MSQVGSSSQGLPQPLRFVASGLRRVPGAEQVGRLADGALERIGAISPRGRRIAVYTGAGVLGVAGVVEWPVALTGAAVAWLTQPRPAPTGQDEETHGSAADTGLRSGAEHVSPGPVHRAAPDAGADTPGPGDRLAPSHFHQDGPAEHVHEQPAKVGDPVTASALKQVAEATHHHHAPHADPSGDKPSGAAAH